jgi:glutamyl/glutaminyl-tRNA synthetase
MGKTKKDEEKTAIKKDKTVKKNKPKPDKVVKDGSAIVKGKTKKKKKSEKAKGIAIEGAAVEQREVYKSQKAVLNRKQGTKPTYDFVKVILDIVMRLVSTFCRTHQQRRTHKCVT